MRIIAALLVLSAAALAQTPRPAFDVASVKLNRSGQYWWTMDPMPEKSGHFFAHNATIKNLLSLAYGEEESRIVGGPAWIASDRYDVEAKSDSRPDRPVVLLMLQSLLADRFKVAVHREQREIPRYALTAPKPAAQLKRVTGRSCPDRSTSGCTGLRFSATGFTGENVAFADLARALTQIIGRTVGDETALSGGYDFKIEWTPGPDSEALSTALWEQLGLKLESRKGSIDALVLDRADRPTAN